MKVEDSQLKILSGLRWLCTASSWPWLRRYLTRDYNVCKFFPCLGLALLADLGLFYLFLLYPGFTLRANLYEGLLRVWQNEAKLLQQAEWRAGAYAPGS